MNSGSSGYKNQNQNGIRAEKHQNVAVNDRSQILVSGVSDVVSFDEKTVVMRTSLGVLTLDGSDLHIVRLDLSAGEAAVTGKLNGMFYTEPSTDIKSGGKLKKLFR